jgi:hypothetical protein
MGPTPENLMILIYGEVTHWLCMNFKEHYKSIRSTDGVHLNVRTYEDIISESMILEIAEGKLDLWLSQR